MDLKFVPAQLTSVEYPGTVNSVQNMERTLGGEDNMFKVFSNSTKRLELKFRPNDPFCKGAHGDRFNSTNVLLKVIKRTRKKPKSEGAPSSEPDVQFSMEILGVADTTYKFKSLADFQVLPVTFDKEKGEHKSMLPSIIPTTLHSAAWLEEPVDLFVPPMLFSRFDLPQSPYAESQNKHQELHQDLPPNIIGRGRKRRTGFAIFSTFDNPEVFSEPKPEAVKQLNSYPLDFEIGLKIKALFEERPIWSRNRLHSNLKCDKARMKYSLPCHGYYFYNGPWRTLWVRFGYDPRKDPSSKIYQTMDIRVHNSIPINEKRYKTRPSYFAIPSKSTQNHQRGATINPKDLVNTNKNSNSAGNHDWHVKKLASEYIPGYLPPARQCFYQLCDVHLPAVQDLLHKNDKKEGECTATDGWLEPGTLDKIREIILNDIQKTVQALKDSETPADN